MGFIERGRELILEGRLNRYVNTFFPVGQIQLLLLRTCMLKSYERS